MVLRSFSIPDCFAEPVRRGEYVFSIARSEQQLDRIFRFRYDVFGREMYYLDEDECPDGRDVDIFDPASAHFLAETEDGEIAGYCRFIYNSPAGFFGEQFFYLPPPPVDRDCLVEISRFAIARDHRGGEPSKKIREGLYEMMYRHARVNGIEYSYLTVHRPFLIMLKRSRIPFSVIDGCELKHYDGYYSKYFDPSDTITTILKAEDFGVYLRKYVDVC